MRTKMVALLVALAATANVGTEVVERTSKEGQVLDDRGAILEHIRSIFEAYLRKDRETIRRTHAEDWVGFLGPSARIERGIRDYMAGAERSLENFDGTGYELIDTEVQLHGDLGLVYYTARYDYEDKGGNRRSLPRRSLDVYRREGGGWIQSGSHIAPIPAGGPWGEGDRQSDPRSAGAGPAGDGLRFLSDGERAALLADREAVWRAWFSSDQERLGQVLPDELIAINAGMSEWWDRERTLQESRGFVAGGGRLVRLQFPRTEILTYGEVAILFTTFEFETEASGQRTTVSGRGTEVFVRRDGRWVNSAWHLDSGD